MLTIADPLPPFRLKAVTADSAPDRDFDIIDASMLGGRWTLLFFWPKDFTFVCPTEILGFDAIHEEFEKRDCCVLGASTDSDFVHLAWRRSRADLKSVRYPWLADSNRALSSALGILDPSEGVARRATFLIDPEGIIRFVQVNDMAVGREPGEVLRVLDALKTEALTPCGWRAGSPVIDPAA